MKTKILFMVGIITLASLLGCILLINDARIIGNGLRTETERHIRALVGKNAGRIGSAMLLMERNAVDLATAGEAFFAIKKATDLDITLQVRTYLMDNFENLPDAIGGGLWYEPNVLFKDRRYFGPYVYRKNGRVFFTWDLNTPAYDYHNQGWYRLGIPEGWDRSRKRPANTYWTDPYFDEAGTRALMITVDALMYDGKTRLIGMSTVDFSLECLKKMVAKLTITPNSLPFAVHLSSGLLISFPSDPSRVMEKIEGLPWGKEIKGFGKATPGKVDMRLLTLNERDFLLFYTVTESGIALGILAPCQELYQHINNLHRSAMQTSVAVILVQVLLYLLIALFLVRRVCNPISRLTHVAQKIADGNLTGASDSLSAVEQGSPSGMDETGRLLTAFQRMTAGLKTLLSQVQRSGTQVASSSVEIAASSREIEKSVKQQAQAIGGVSASSEEISSTAKTLAGTMNELVTAASETAVLAESGHAGLEEMEISMQGVLHGTESVSTRLEEIKENAKSIGSIVSTITNVADQTNLLSLNAAIEAEKAGEYGLGFSVVAGEIRRLADQTSVAVLDIEEMVGRMEKAVTAGASEMDTFSGQVGSAVELITTTGKQLNGIVDRVLTLTPRFQDVNEGMEAQSARAEEINETMNRLRGVMGGTVEALREFNIAAEYLREAAKGLQDEISRFRVG